MSLAGSSPQRIAAPRSREVHFAVTTKEGPRSRGVIPTNYRERGYFLESTRRETPAREDASNAVLSPQNSIFAVLHRATLPAVLAPMSLPPRRRHNFRTTGNFASHVREGANAVSTGTDRARFLRFNFALYEITTPDVSNLLAEIRSRSCYIALTRVVDKNWRTGRSTEE